MAAFFISRKYLSNILLWVCLVYIAGIFLRGSVPSEPAPKGELAGQEDKKVQFVARVCSEPELSLTDRRLALCPLKQAGKVLAFLPLYPSYEFGDVIKVTGKLMAPPRFEAFDYERYLKRSGIHWVIYRPTIFVEGKEETTIFSKILMFKHGLRTLIEKNLPEPEAGLADALLLGYRRTVSKEDLAMFSRVGLSHMIAISGSHMTLMSALLSRFLAFFRLKKRWIRLFVILFLIFYPWLTGLAPSAIRASIMGAIALYWKGGGDSILPLALAGALMLAFEPHLMLEDAGFQLSFTAMLGLMYIYPIIKNFGDYIIRKLKEGKARKALEWINDSFSLCLASQLAILPVCLLNFGQISLIAPLANLFVLFTFAPLIVSLIAAITMSSFVPFLSIFSFFPSYLILRYIFILSELLATPKLAALSLPSFSATGAAIYYILLATAIIGMRKLGNKKDPLFRAGR